MCGIDCSSVSSSSFVNLFLLSVGMEVYLGRDKCLRLQLESLKLFMLLLNDCSIVSSFSVSLDSLVFVLSGVGVIQGHHFRGPNICLHFLMPQNVHSKRMRMPPRMLAIWMRKVMYCLKPNDAAAIC